MVNREPCFDVTAFQTEGRISPIGHCSLATKKFPSSDAVSSRHRSTSPVGSVGVEKGLVGLGGGCRSQGSSRTRAGLRAGLVTAGPRHL